MAKTEEKKENEMYCVKCRAKREVKDAKVTEFKNEKTGQIRYALRGQCPECGTNTTKFIAAPKKS